MRRKPTWEDADLLLRIHDLESRPETQKAFDWFRAHQTALVNLPEAEFQRGTLEFEYGLRIAILFELIGVLVKMGMLNEQAVLEFWNVWDPWRVFRLTIERERKVIGSWWVENFEWLAQRDERWRARRNRRSPSERRSRAP